MGFFGLQRKGRAVKTGNLSTQAVSTEESRKNSSVLQKGKAKKRLLRRRRRRSSSSVQTTGPTTVSTRTSSEVRVAAFAAELERLRAQRANPNEIYVQTGPSTTITLRSPSQRDNAPTTNSTNSTPAALRYSDDILDLAESRVTNSQFEPVERNGVTSFRPEVISISNFSPIYSGNSENASFSNAGKFIHLQQQILNVRKETLIQLLASMEQWKSDKTQEALNSVQLEFNDTLSRTERTIEFYDRFINALETSKENLDIRNVNPNKGGVMPLNDFMESVLQFSKLRQQYFSSSKLYLQLCADFKSVLENYSFALLDLIDPDRTGDTSPIDIDNTYTTKDGFSFSIDSIRSTDAAINASNSQHFNSFMNSLPQDNSDRVKLLVTLLSKEYRVSKNLSQPKVSKPLLEIFSQQDSGSPFDNIVGIPGDTIFDSPTGTNSLSALAHIGLGPNSIVLPLENKYIDSETSGKTFVPGSSYFFDTIVASSNNNQFNTKPYIDYVDLFTQTTNTATGLINNLLELDDKKSSSSKLTPENMYDSLLTSVKTSMNGLLTTKSINKDQGASLALMKLANTDAKLKNMLFQFCIFAGIASYTKEDAKEIFINLAKELKTTNAISYARVIARLSIDLTDTTKLGVVQTYLQDLAQDIEDRTFLLVAGREIPRRNLGSQTSKENGVTNDYSSLDLLGTVVPNLDRRAVFLNEGDIKTILMSLVTPETIGTTTVFKEFLNKANEFTAAASINGTSAYLLPDGTGRTRYNYLSTSMQTLIMFEVFSSLTSKYAAVSFNKSRYVDKILIDVDAKTIRFVDKTITEITSRGLPNVRGSRLGRNPSAGKELGESTPSIRGTSPSVASQSRFDSINNALPVLSNENNQPRRNSSISGGPTATAVRSQEDIERDSLTQEEVELRNNMIANRNKISKENLVISNFLDLFNELNTQLRNGKSVISNTFNSNTLQSFLSENTQGELDIIKNPTQTRVASFSLNEFQSIAGQNEIEQEENSSKYEAYVIDDIPSNQQLKAMEALLKMPSYGEAAMADERLKILSIGIPAGLSRRLSDRIVKEKISKESFLQRQADVITCLIYKRDARYDDIVFKPKKFAFDLSLFLASQDIKNIEPREGETFNELLLRSQLTDLQNPKHKRKVSIDSIKQDQTYNFLSNSQKEQLIFNHVQSSLLEVYLRLMTNMKLQETTFISNDFVLGTNLNKDIQALTYSYIQESYGLNLGDIANTTILEDDNADATIQDIIRLVTYGSKMFEPSSIREQIISSKMFDRVFHIPVSVDNFEIDIETTKQTESGRLALLQNFVQDSIVETSDQQFIFSSQDPENDIAFADFFITIETEF